RFMTHQLTMARKRREPPMTYAQLWPTSPYRGGAATDPAHQTHPSPPKGLPQYGACCPGRRSLVRCDLLEVLAALLPGRTVQHLNRVGFVQLQTGKHRNPQIDLFDVQEQRGAHVPDPCRAVLAAGQDQLAGK